MANLVAVPVAGLVMLYGLPACLLAGVVPAVGVPVMAPVGWGVWWVDAVATVAAAPSRAAVVVGGLGGLLVRSSPSCAGATACSAVRAVGAAPRSSRPRRPLGTACVRRRRPARAPNCDDGGAMSVHLLTGDDESLLRAAVSELVHELVGDGDRSLMVDEFDGEDVELRAVVDAAQTPPFLTERRVVVARDVGRFSADDVAPLVAYLADPLPIDRARARRRGGRLPKALTDAVKAAGGTSRSTDPPSRARDRQAWVVEHAAATGVKLAPPAAALVAERLGEDVGRLDGLLATLAATFGGDAAAGAGGRRAVHRRGRRGAAVGPHRRHRRRQHGDGARPCWSA